MVKDFISHNYKIQEEINFSPIVNTFILILSIIFGSIGGYVVLWMAWSVVKGLIN